MEPLEDLLHMTRENQLLHGQLLRVRQQHDELSAAATEHRARARPREEELGEREAERESAVRLYQQALDQRQRNQAQTSHFWGSCGPYPPGGTHRIDDLSRGVSKSMGPPGG